MTEQLLFVAATGFEAARQMRLPAAEHRSNRLHGHSFLASVRAALPELWADYPGGELVKLHEQLVNVVKPLDYEYLNKIFQQPADEHLARWLRNRLALLDADSVEMQSTRDAGVILARNGDAHIWRKYGFEAAHQLPNVPHGHKCGRMHGHGFEVVLHANQDLDICKISIDYDQLDALWAPIRQQLDFACLNDIPGLSNPTSELISSWIWQRLKPQLPELSWVTVYETAHCGAHFDGSHYRIWKEMSFDSALRLKHAPAGDPRQRIHGHTYTLRLHLQAPLDEVMGWAVDFGDVKSLFTPVFKQLDHHPLYAIADVDDNDAASLVRYIRRQSQAILPQLDRVDLYEKSGCGVILRWGDHIPVIPV